MSVQVLGGAVGHEVCAKLDRALNRRTREGVVHGEPNAARVSGRRHRRQVGDPHQRIAWRFDEQQLSRRRKCPLDGRDVRGVHIREGERITRQHFLEQPDRSAIDVIGNHHVVAGLQERGDRIDRRHARGKRKRRLAFLHRGDVAFERSASRILRAGVLVAFVFSERFLHVGRGLINRGDDGAGRGVGCLAGVQTDCTESRVWSELHDPLTIPCNIVA
jgi:hypothetical protein